MEHLQFLPRAIQQVDDVFTWNLIAPNTPIVRIVQMCVWGQNHLSQQNVTFAHSSEPYIQGGLLRCWTTWWICRCIFRHHTFALHIFKNCIGRESNPGLPRGRREFYHWTTDAITATLASAPLTIYWQVSYFVKHVKHVPIFSRTIDSSRQIDSSTSRHFF